VLDVGCGTGVLSIFAARAGAKHVYGVDKSNIANQARQIVLDNGLDRTVTIIQGEVEELELPVATVDIIVSEWMGFCLFFESMLDSVLFARDKWLSPGGLIFPDVVRLYVCGIEDHLYKQRLDDCWNQRQGFSYKSMKNLEKEEAVVDHVKPFNVVTNVALLKQFNLEVHNKQDVEFDTEFELCSTGERMLTGFTTYFDVEFSHCHLASQFSTGPMSQVTHWQQTSFYLRGEYNLAKEEIIRVSLT
jgi:protein arginine N-methyltransferase 1